MDHPHGVGGAAVSAPVRVGGADLDGEVTTRLRDDVDAPHLQLDAQGRRTRRRERHQLISAPSRCSDELACAASAGRGIERRRHGRARARC